MVSLAFLLGFLKLSNPAAYADVVPLPLSPEEWRAAEKAMPAPYPKPEFVELTLNQDKTLDAEIIAWPDGSVSVPLITLAKYFNFTVNLSERFNTLFLLRKPFNAYPAIQGSINWETQVMQWNSETLRPSKHPFVWVKQGTVLEQEIYIDLALAEKLLDASIRYNPEEAALNVNTHYLSVKNNPLTTYPTDEAIPHALSDERTRIDPQVLHGVIEKIKLVQTTQTQSQQINQPLDLSGNVLNTGHQFMVSRTMANIEGTLFGQPYHLQPSLLAYNRKFNLENIEGSLLHTGRKTDITVGSLNVGPSPLISPLLKVWGLKITSHDTPEGYSINSADKMILPAGQGLYSTFIGRNPVQFYPVIPGQTTRLLLPQSTKLLIGGNYMLGLTNRLSAGAAFAADYIMGNPKTYNPLRFPLAADLSGFSSYLRDPNYFNGATVGFATAYQLSKHWQVSTDLGLSHYQLKSGSGLKIPESDLGKAIKGRLSYHYGSQSASAELFRYDAGYYSPETTRFGLPLYDRQGGNLTLNGILLPAQGPGLNYMLQWEHARTNLQHYLPGGAIAANHYSGTFSRQLAKNLSINWNFNLINGNNQERKSILKSNDISLKTLFPHKMEAEVRVNRYFTNALYFPGLNNHLVLVKNSYTNNGVNASLTLPLKNAQNTYIKIGNQLSSFVNYFYLKGRLQFKNIFLEPYLQESYGNGPQIQNKAGCKLGYHWPNGATVSVAYYKTLNSFNSPKSFLPAINIDTHEVYFEFSQVLGFAMHNIQTLGTDNTATLTGLVFMDYDRDGKYTPVQEKGLKNVQLKLDATRSIQTNASGHYQLSGLEPGEHKLELVSDNLPITVGLENKVYQFKVTPGKTLQWDIALPFEGLALKGHLVVQTPPQLPKNAGDALKDNVPKSDAQGMVLVLKDATGKIVNYTTADANGQYEFNSLPLGKYQVGLDPQIETGGRYKLLKQPPEIIATAAPLKEDSPIVLHSPDLILLKLF